MDIYERINALLKSKTLTRKDLCAATGLSYSTLTSLFQRKSKNMRLETIRAIAGFLAVSVDYLVLGAEAKPDMVAESEGPAYGASFEETEIRRILPMLSKRGKTILLAKAYELREKEQVLAVSARVSLGRSRRNAAVP
ncbi:MAG: XRE family transcriptional regulator [Bacillus subtilis]|nr:XRE family transcriptional regulator [Bacillus subtilis]